MTDEEIVEAALISAGLFERVVDPEEGVSVHARSAADLAEIAVDALHRSGSLSSAWNVSDIRRAELMKSALDQYKKVQPNAYRYVWTMSPDTAGEFEELWAGGPEWKTGEWYEMGDQQERELDLLLGLGVRIIDGVDGFYLRPAVRGE